MFGRFGRLKNRAYLIFDWQRYFHVAQNLFDASHQVFKVFREEVADVSDAERVSDLPWVNDLIFVAELLVKHLEVEVGVRRAEVGRDDVTGMLVGHQLAEPHFCQTSLQDGSVGLVPGEKMSQKQVEHKMNFLD